MKNYFLMIIFMLSFIVPQKNIKKPCRELGVEIGILRPGRNNSITDVKGVLVGHKTIIKGDNIRTGVTAVIPHGNNVFQQKVTAAVYTGNGFGKAMGFTQAEELGNIETPVVLTNTLSVPVAASAVIKYILGLEGNEQVRSVNAVVGETNDGYLNDIRGMHVTEKDVMDAINSAKSGATEQGSVGAGTGTSCLGFKGGIGTSSRIIPQKFGGYTVGVLVQSNFGGILRINGAPVGREMGKYFLSNRLDYSPDGSCMIIIATDAPLSSRNLKRIAKRSMLAFGRVGSFQSNGSGDYAIAFTTAPGKRIPYRATEKEMKTVDLHNDFLSPLFLAVVEATEEAILNSLFVAESVTGINGHSVAALPVDEVLKILEKYNSLNWKSTLPSEK